MKSKVDNIRLQYTEDTTELVLSLCIPRKKAQNDVQRLKEVLGRGKYLQAEIKQYRQKRRCFW